jgi:GAF domain-containing protein
MFPSREESRLQLLRSYGILDTDPEKGFHDITRAASLVCGTPIATITLVDESRQWFKSRVGLESSESPREFSFCGQAMKQHEPLIVPNAEKDPRFPTIHSSPAIPTSASAKASAGEPLRHRPHAAHAHSRTDAILKILTVAGLSRLQLRRALHLIERPAQLPHRLIATDIAVTQQDFEYD